MFRTIRSVENFYQLQRDVNMLFAWFKKQQLKFNISKCNGLYLGPPHEFSEYLIDGTAITSYKFVRDLGILIDNHLKFHDHTTAADKEANRILAVIYKTFQCFDHNTVINLYKSYIRPVLECGNIIWGQTTIYLRSRTNRESIEKSYKVDVRSSKLYIQ